MSSELDSDPKRLFFALWPEPALQQCFFEAGTTLFAVCGGRRTRRENIHLTLAFLGPLDAERLQRVIKVATQIQRPEFELQFDRLGWWRHNQVAWAATSETPRELLDLVETLQLGLAQEGFKFDARRFEPHVTLLRKAQCRENLLESEPINWRIKEFVLVRSTLHPEGAHYTIEQRWPLAN